MANLVIILVVLCSFFPYDCDLQQSTFVPSDYYLQECGAEAPYQCNTAKKALGQSCLLDTDCVQPATCQQAKCRCPKGYLQYRERCVRSPGLDERCLDGRCPPHLVCTSRDVCDCPPTTTERIGSVCQSKCLSNQTLVDGECLKIAKLQGRCKSSLQCPMAYAYCDQGRCQCVAGTTAANDRCVATPICPDGYEPLRGGVDFLRCHSQPCATGQLPSLARVKLDSCPAGYHCIFPSYQDADGFCCPDTPYCPTGTPSHEKNCLNPRSEAERCPTETHHCYAAPRGTYCCPLPCPSFTGTRSIVVEDGLCYEKKQLNEQCVVHSQCPQPAQCMNETCQCPTGYDIGYGPLGKKCRRQCQSGAVLVGEQCLALVLPTERCNHSAQCTKETKCLAGRCHCPCGKIFYNAACVDMPQCPSFGSGAYDPLMTVNQESLIECSPTDRTSNSPSCPDKAFCYPALVYSGGICCPLPEPTCPGGTAPSRDRNDEVIMCDIGTGSTATCDRGAYCHDYSVSILPSLAQVASRRGVCCPMQIGAIGGTQTPWPISPFGRQPVSTSFDACPAGYQVQTTSIGQPMRCPLYSYQGQCGYGSTCTANPNVADQFPNNEGLCCRPIG